MGICIIILPMHKYKSIHKYTHSYSYLCSYTTTYTIHICSGADRRWQSENERLNIVQSARRTYSNAITYSVVLYTESKMKSTIRPGIYRDRSGSRREGVKRDRDREFNPEVEIKIESR